ncbi:hypothetical protein IP88_07570 [alpha proteobacterium AAP81b]|nr:hypothetical protein IP88_07570 [alpha proteobacterium AAP81b]
MAIGLKAAFLAGVMLAVPALAQAPAARPAATRLDGYVPLLVANGKLSLEIPAFGSDVLYYVSAASGGGSVELPFDRGVLEAQVIRFERAGGKVLVVAQNLDYRSLAGDAAHAEGVRDSFPTSVLAALPIESEAGGKVIVDATPLLMRDAADVETTLKKAGQGNFKFDAGRSALYGPRTKAFPDNSEVETIATFATDAGGALVANVTPDARAFTLRVHHSFLRPPTGYVPRVADPRIGISTIRFKDFSKPFSERPDTEWVTRWRLEKRDPGAALSAPVKPITFWFDPAIPLPIRRAMQAGCRFWNTAFIPAGFKDAVACLDAPADMDPMDIRYAYVLWINRDERGFSSGGTFRDPRTGEIFGAKVRMDSARIRTIASYWDAYAGGLPGDGAGLMAGDPAVVDDASFAGMPKGQRDLVLQRQALLTAHELGHSIGFQHNFASSLNDRASVMDYPTPRVKVTNGKLDLSEAFMRDTGAYDAFMVRYAYTPLVAEKAGLEAIVAEMRAKGIIFTSDNDPRWTWYDDRATPTEGLGEALAARRIMLAGYGDAALTPGEPYGSLRDMRLWMVYLHHRYAVEAAAKYIGGQFQSLALKGEPQPATGFIPAKLQAGVLDLLIGALEPAELALPEPLLAKLAEDPGDTKEDLSSDPVFDQLKAARIAAALVVEPLLDGARAARLVALAARDPGGVTLAQLLDRLLAASWNAPAAGSARDAALRRVVQGVVLDGLMICGATTTSPEARALVLDRVARLGADLGARKGGDAVTAAWAAQAARDIARYLEDPAKNAPKSASAPWGKGPRSRFPQPPGPPLG